MGNRLSGDISAWQQNEDVQWKIFNDLDMQDEAEMLELAVFLQTILGTFGLRCASSVGGAHEL